MAIQKLKEPVLDILEDNDEDGLDTLVNSSVHNKNNGFTRVGPATFAEKAKQQETKKPSSENENTNGNQNQTKSNLTPNPRSHITEKYCHFFSNFGECHWEQTTGRKCKFTHRKAPVCNFDGNCNRKKCMFSHVRQMTPPG